MKSCVPVLLVVLVLPLMPAQNASRTETAPSHFQWSESQAHELDYDHTILKSPTLTPVEKKSLIDTIVQTLKRDDAEEAPASELIHVASNTRIELVDLKGDGGREIIAQGNDLGPCGAANCIFWIFELTPTGVKVLLDSTLAGATQFELVTVRSWKTNGYKDIVLASHSSATARNIAWFRYANGAYRPSACFYLNWIGDHGESLKNPNISREPCG